MELVAAGHGQHDRSGGLVVERRACGTGGSARTDARERWRGERQEDDSGDVTKTRSSAASPRFAFPGTARRRRRLALRVDPYRTYAHVSTGKGPTPARAALPKQ